MPHTSYFIHCSYSFFFFHVCYLTNFTDIHWQRPFKHLRTSTTRLTTSPQDHLKLRGPWRKNWPLDWTVLPLQNLYITPRLTPITLLPHLNNLPWLPWMISPFPSALRTSLTVERIAWRWTIPRPITLTRSMTHTATISLQVDASHLVSPVSVKSKLLLNINQMKKSVTFTSAPPITAMSWRKLLWVHITTHVVMLSLWMKMEMCSLPIQVITSRSQSITLTYDDDYNYYVVIQYFTCDIPYVILIINFWLIFHII